MCKHVSEFLLIKIHLPQLHTEPQNTHCRQKNVPILPICLEKNTVYCSFIDTWKGRRGIQI